MRNIAFYLIVLSSLLFGTSAMGQQKIYLSGAWQIAFDSAKVSRDVVYTDNINLPGNTDLAGLGEVNTLQPALTKPQILHLTRRHSYIGVAWYKREIEITKEMANRPLSFTFERVMWKSNLLVDGKYVSLSEKSLVAPHCYDLREGLTEGKHTIELRIDNRKQYDITERNLAHAYTNDTQTMWNGVLGEMSMTVHNRLNLYFVEVYPDVDNKSVKVTAYIENYTKKPIKDVLTINVGNQRIKTDVTLKPDMQTVNVTVPMPEAKLWSEFHPDLYDLTATIGDEGKTISFGMRSLKVEDGNLTVNGNRIFLRGTLECCVFPLRGCPPTDENGWEKVFCTAKEWGLNHLRFHSWCPPDAAFRVADKMGFYLQIELPDWALNVNSDSATVEFLRDEFLRISMNYGNHPSFCLMTCGNELQPDFKYLNDFVAMMKNFDNRHLYSTTSFTFEKGHGGKPEPQDEFFVTQWTFANGTKVDNGWVRGQGVLDKESPCFDKDYSKATRDVNVPLISHEIGQYSVYPNMKEIDKYTGTLDPLNFKAIRNDLQEKGLLDKAAYFTEASGRFASLLYKEELERAMKTPRFNGYQMLGLMDFPGQGTALVGLLDAFWDSKGVCTAEEFRQYCAPVVPLARFEKATYYNNETFQAQIEVANYTEDDINKSVSWKLCNDNGNICASGVLPYTNIVKGGNTPVGDITVSLANIGVEAKRLTLNLAVDGTQWKNSWHIWVYPVRSEEFAVKSQKSKIVLTQNINEALKQLKKGRRVLLAPKAAAINGIESKFLPVFWSPIHFPKQAGTMGILCDPKHPAFAHFPTENHSDWQWWHIVKNAKVMNLSFLPTGAGWDEATIIEAVDNFANNRRLGYVFEANVLKGKLLMCSIDLLSDITGKPAMQQLLYSLTQYMQSTDFNPSKTIITDELRSLIKEDLSAKATK